MVMFIDIYTCNQNQYKTIYLFTKLNGQIHLKPQIKLSWKDINLDMEPKPVE